MAVSGGGADDWVCVIEPWVMVVAELMAVVVVGDDGWVCVMMAVKRREKET